jgi:hypothetical protein
VLRASAWADLELAVRPVPYSPALASTLQIRRPLPTDVEVSDTGQHGKGLPGESDPPHVVVRPSPMDSRSRTVTMAPVVAPTDGAECRRSCALRQAS